MKELLDRLTYWSEKFGGQTRIVIYDDGSGHVQAANKSEWGIPSDDTRVATFSSLEEFLTMPVMEEE
jgi:hypothetical protein